MDLYWIVFFNPIQAAKLIVQNEPLVVTLMFILVFFNIIMETRQKKLFKKVFNPKTNLFTRLLLFGRQKGLLLVMKKLKIGDNKGYFYKICGDCLAKPSGQPVLTTGRR